jgi:outer membrane protein OmpA-like peptidoglycan-associated protein
MPRIKRAGRQAFRLAPAFLGRIRLNLLGQRAPVVRSGKPRRDNMRALMIAAAAATLMLGACATDPVTGERIAKNTGRGAAIGAISGAAAGVLAGGNDTRNAAIGAAVGAIAGATVGGYMDRQEAELRRRTAQTQIEVARNGNQIELRMPADVTFPVNQSTIQSGFYPSLNEVARTLTEYPSTAIDIIGHADSDGAEAYNQELSERRAESVRAYLGTQGVQTVRMVASGRGETQPLVPNTSAANKAQNRRVQIVLTPVTQG